MVLSDLNGYHMALARLRARAVVAHLDVP